MRYKTIAKGQKQIQEQAVKRSEQDLVTAHAAQDRLVNNPQIEALGKHNLADRTAFENGTYADSSRFQSNRDAAAQRNSLRSKMNDISKIGAGSMGVRYVHPTQLAMVDNNLRDQNARDTAIQHEQDRRTFSDQLALNEDGYINRKTGLDANIMASALGQSNFNFSQAAQIASQRASLLPSILGSAISGAAQVGAAYAGNYGSGGASSVAGTTTNATNRITNNISGAWL